MCLKLLKSDKRTEKFINHQIKNITMKRGILNTILPYAIAGYTALATAGLLIEDMQPKPQKNQSQIEKPCQDKPKQEFGILENQADQLQAQNNLNQFLSNQFKKQSPDTFTPDPMQGYQGTWGAQEAINFLAISEPNTLEGICTEESRCNPNQETNKFQAHGMMQVKDNAALEALRAILSPDTYTSEHKQVRENHPELITEKAQYLDPKDLFSKIQTLYQLVDQRNKQANQLYNKAHQEIKNGNKSQKWIPLQNHALYKQLQKNKSKAQEEIKNTRNLLTAMKKAFYGPKETKEKQRYEESLSAIQGLNGYLITLTEENIDHVTLINQERSKIEAILEENKTNVRTNVVLADTLFQLYLLSNDQQNALAAYNAGPRRSHIKEARKYAENVQEAINQIGQ